VFSVCGRGLEDFLFIHLKSPWTAFHGSAVLRGIYKKTHPAQWVGLEDGSLFLILIEKYSNLLSISSIIMLLIN
jgi:hypothetical protein